MKINNPDELSLFLKHKRTKNRRSQADVSSKIGLQQQTISAIENNSNKSKIETLFKIINELGLEFHLIEKPIPGQKNSKKGKECWHEEW